MRWLFQKHLGWYIAVIVLLSGALYYWYFHHYAAAEAVRETTTIDFGTIRSSVIVSGKVEAKDLAHLTFPVSGTIASVFVEAGDEVEAGDVLASLKSDVAVAEYTAGLEQLRFLTISRAELLRGLRTEARAVVAENVRIAEEQYRRTEAELQQTISNLRRTYLTTGLEARPVDLLNNNRPPTVTGTYTCEGEGEYRLRLYRSNAPNQLTYDFSGLESGRANAYTDTAAPLGECGLYIQFDTTEFYRDGEWIISVPNPLHPMYVANKNALELAETQRTTALSAASDAITLARRTETSQIASPTSEELGKLDASIQEAKARLAQAEVRIAEYTIRAPFAGLITKNDLKLGEVASPAKSIQIIKAGGFKLKSRVPETAIKRIDSEQTVIVTFDAARTETFRGRLTFISPVALEIDGVAYYEATIELVDNPSWLRAGLNADVEVVVNERTDVPTLHERFIIRDGEQTFVLVDTPTGLKQEVVGLGARGSNGLVEIIAGPLNQTLVLP